MISNKGVFILNVENGLVDTNLNLHQLMDMFHLNFIFEIESN